MKYITRVNGNEYEIDIPDSGQSPVTVNQVAKNVELDSLGSDSSFSLLVNHRSHQVFVKKNAAGYQVSIGHKTYSVEVEDERTRRIRSLIKTPSQTKGRFEVRAPMPGLIVRFNVEEGHQVTVGDSLLIIEAMKMENEIRAQTAGTVKKILKQEKDSVEKDSVLLLIE